MGKRGPKNKPTILNIIRGNPRHRPIDKDEPKPPKVKSPHCPKDLCEDGEKEWRRVAPLLTKLGLLTTVDLASLERYCGYHGMYKQAMRSVKKNGRQFPVKDKDGKVVTLKKIPDVDIALKFGRLADQAGARFGLSPSDRVGLTMPIRDGKDELDELING